MGVSDFGKPAMLIVETDAIGEVGRVSDDVFVFLRGCFVHVLLIGVAHVRNKTNRQELETIYIHDEAVSKRERNDESGDRRWTSGCSIMAGKWPMV